MKRSQPSACHLKAGLSAARTRGTNSVADQRAHVRCGQRCAPLGAALASSPRRAFGARSRLPPPRRSATRRAPRAGACRAACATSSRRARRRSATGDARLSRRQASRRCEQPAVRDADRWQVEDRAELQCQARSARMVAAGRVHEERVRALRQRADSRLEHWSLAQRKQSRLVRVARHAGDHGVGDEASAAADRGTGPSRLALASWSRPAAFEADKASCRSNVFTHRPPRGGRSARPTSSWEHTSSSAVDGQASMRPYWRHGRAPARLRRAEGRR